jgi:hypothetical protein
VGISASTTWDFRTVESEDVETVQSGAVEILHADRACESGVITGVVRVTAQGADRFMLANDATYQGGVWQTMPANTMDISWTFPTSADQASVYALFEGENGGRISVMTTVAVADQECEEAEEDEGIGEEEGGTSASRLIKGASFSAVYLLEEGKRKPFPNEHIFFTRFSSFDDVEVLTDAELAAIPMGSPVLPKEGSLIKIQSLAPVYLVSLTSAGYVITHIPNEAAAAEQFGENWASLVMDIEPTLFRYFIQE